MTEIIEAVPGGAEHELLEVSGDTDHLVEAATDKISSKLALEFQNPFLQAFAYKTTHYLLLEGAQHIFEGLSGVATGNAMSFTLAQLKVWSCLSVDILSLIFKDMVKEILSKLNIILDEPSQSCCDLVCQALQAIQDGEHGRAKHFFEDAINKALQGEVKKIISR